MQQKNYTEEYRNVCKFLPEAFSEKDRSFVAVHMHGDELKEELKIPDGIRIIMFCYSGKKLDICPRFDLFNWKHLFFDKSATENYCTFLATMSMYSTLRDHFCIFESGDTIRDIDFTPDVGETRDFQDGIFTLPVQAIVKDTYNDVTYVSDSDLFTMANTNMPARRIVYDEDAAARLIKEKTYPTLFASHVKKPLFSYTLSQLIGEYKALGVEKTILILTCRNGDVQKMQRGTRVYDAFDRFTLGMMSALDG